MADSDLLSQTTAPATEETSSTPTTSAIEPNAMRQQALGNMGALAALQAPNQQVSLPSSVAGGVENTNLSGITVVKDSTEAADKGLRGFAQGDSIHVAPGQFSDEVVFHELAHVLQQRKGRTDAEEVASRSELEAQADEAQASGHINYDELSGGPDGLYELSALSNAVKNMETSASRGQFVEAKVDVSVPTPVTGLAVTVGGSGSLYVDQDGKKEAEFAVSVGIKWSFLEIFELNAQVTAALKLRGNDLGAAFVDAIKQTVYHHLRKQGIYEQFDDLVRLAEEGPGLKDFGKLALGTMLAGPFAPAYATVHGSKLILSQVDKQRIIQARDAFTAFFANNASVGFEISIGVGVGAKVEAGGKGASVSLQAVTGLDDVDDISAESFTELSGELSFKNGNNEVTVRIAKRSSWLRAYQTITVEVKGALSTTSMMPTGPDNMLGDAVLIAGFHGLFGEASKTKSGGSLNTIGTLGGAFLNLVARTSGVRSDNLDSLVGLDLSVTKELDGLRDIETWNAAARLKSMVKLGDKMKAGGVGVEADVKVGSFVDASAKFKNSLLSGAA